MPVILYGASDDLIELEGDIYEEFNLRNDDSNGDLVAFSDGTVLRIHYSNSGIWRIAPLVSGRAALTVDQAPEDDDGAYTDRAKLDGDIRWAVHGIAWAGAR